MKNNIVTPEYNSNGTFLRYIRSFVCRNGRVTKSQLKYIKKYWSTFGVDFSLKKIDFSTLFSSDLPIILEIGFGSGLSLVNMAIYNPHKNFLGIEVYKSGIGSCLNYAALSKINNLRIIYHDAVEVFYHMIPNQTISVVQIFFPDPWNKIRHHKRRLLKLDFLQVIEKKLKKQGILHIITDSKSYFLNISRDINDIKTFFDSSISNDLLNLSLSRSITKFEKKANFLGNKIYELIREVR